MSHTDLKPQLCPVCGTLSDAATSVEGTWVPTPGDPCVCLACGAYLKFNKEMILVKMSAPDLYEMTQSDPEGFMKLVETAGLIELYRNMAMPKPAKEVKN